MTDLFFYDSEKLASLASEPIIKRGIKYHQDKRVFDLTWDANRIQAMVDGTQTEPYFVELSLDQDQELLISCSCPFDWEPACKHAVATLLAYADQVNQEPDLSNAADQAVSDRRRRGRFEVVVQHLSGDAPFGVWQARSLKQGRVERDYQVHLRHLEARRNFCTCMDFATNLLGTCKHVEAVVYRAGKKKRRLKKRTATSRPFVYVAWDVPDAPKIQLHRSGDQDPETEGFLDQYFDEAGHFQGELGDFFRFRNQAARYPLVEVGPDAVSLAEQRGEEKVRHEREKLLAERIRRSGGRLPGVNARLYPYQVEGVAHLAAKGRALLADDMGLGKTLQSIAAAEYLRREASVQRILVVCPASLKAQWAREIQKFVGLEAVVIQGNPAVRAQSYGQKPVIAIVNYEMLLRDLEVITRDYAPDLLILDEAQRIRNWRTKSAEAVKALESRYVFVLTGTPLENRLEDLYSIMQVVDPRILGPLWLYMNHFHVLSENGKVMGYRNLSEIRERIKPVALRRDRSLVAAQLPERIEHNLDINMTPQQREMHDTAMQIAAGLQNTAAKRPLTPSEENRLMAALQQARMACNAAGLVDKVTKTSPKLDELKRLLEDLCVEGSAKAVVFSQWERMTVLAEEVCNQLSLGVVRLHGGVPTAKRGDLIQRFYDDPTLRVFLSTDAGAVGLNLQNAEVMINLDLPFNPAILEQRIARIHRLGQTRPCQVIKLVCTEGYEGRIAELIRDKRDLFENVLMDGAEKDVVGISAEKLAQLAKEEREIEPGDETESEVETRPRVETAEPQPKQETKDAPEITLEDIAVRLMVSEIQQRLGDRLEKLLGAGGGILGLVATLDDEIEAIAATFKGPIPFTIMDIRNYNLLQRLKGASPIHDAGVLWEADAAKETHSPLWDRALEQLKAGRMLVDQALGTAAMSLLSNGLVATLCARSGQRETPDDAALMAWLFGEARMEGWVSEEEALLVTKAAGFGRTANLPTGLAREVLGQVEYIFAASAPDGLELGESGS